MNLVQAVSIIEREIVDARNTASTWLCDANKSDLPRNRQFFIGFWSGNKQGLDFALEELKKLKRLCPSEEQGWETFFACLFWVVCSICLDSVIPSKENKT